MAWSDAIAYWGERATPLESYSPEVIAANLCYAPAMAKKDKTKPKTNPAPTMGGDPNLPSKDGPYVSENGGLYFVGVIVALIILAAAGQLLLTN